MKRLECYKVFLCVRGSVSRVGWHIVLMPHLTRARVPTWSGLGSTTSRSAAGSQPSDLVTVPRHILHSIREQAYQVMARIDEILVRPEPQPPHYSEEVRSRRGRSSDVVRDRSGGPVERGRSSGAPRPSQQRSQDRRDRDDGQEPRRGREPTRSRSRRGRSRDPFTQREPAGHAMGRVMDTKAKAHMPVEPPRKNPRQPRGRPPAPERKCPPPSGQACFYEQSPNFKKKCLGGATHVIKTCAKGRLVYTCEICGEWQVRDEVAEWAPDDYDVGE